MGLTKEQKEEREKAVCDIKTYDFIGEENYVFISYKSDDWKIVLDEVVRHMVEHYGLRVYFDRNFDRDNDMWINNMKKAITTGKCRAVLAFVSKKYMTSYACVMELLTARSQQAQMSFDDSKCEKLQIIPILIDESGSVEGAASKSGRRVNIKEWEREKYHEILKDTKKSRWVQGNTRLIDWLDRLAEYQEWTEENFSKVAELILNEGHNRTFSRKSPIFYEDLRQTIDRCSDAIFDTTLISKGAAKAENTGSESGSAKAEHVGTGSGVSYLEYWTGFQTYALNGKLSGGLRPSKAGNHNWYAIWLDNSVFRIECSVNTRKNTLRTAFFVQNAPDRFNRLEQAKTAIETALESEKEIVWDGKFQAANISVFGFRQGKSTEEQYEWFCRTAEKLYAAVSPYLG